MFRDRWWGYRLTLIVVEDLDLLVGSLTGFMRQRRQELNSGPAGGRADGFAMISGRFLPVARFLKNL